MKVFYNENEPYPVQWLRCLSAEGHIPKGIIDSRSIVDIKPRDLREVTQAHFFAGIGGWAYALKLAGWPARVPVWTGSCPCQPFSTAGRRKGKEDARHLWPVWFELIRKRRPPVIFGEQVASPDGLNWLDAVHADLEGAGYAVGTADLCAAGVGAPHMRQRLYFVAVSREQRCKGERIHLRPRKPRSTQSETAWGGEAYELGNTNSSGSSIGQRTEERHGTVRDQRTTSASSGATAGFWIPADWLLCSDGKARPVEPGSLPLAHGVPARVGKLRAYGNAIVPQLGAAFIRAAVASIREIC